MADLTDLYAFLGVSRDATPEEIRRAYHEAARRLHPDVNVEVGATESFLRVQQAYEVLSDPNRRAAYDSVQPAQPEPDAPISLNILYSRSTLPMIEESQLVYTVVELNAIPDHEQRPPAALNVSLVLDRSTSMQGERMDMVKSAAIEVVHQMRPDDLLSIILFGDRAEVLLPSGRWSSNVRIENQIQMIRPGGGTEILRGLEAALFEVRRNLRKDRINHILLLTDGRTYGDESACLSLADRAAASGIGISGLGIGEDWNDVFLDDLTRRTGGSSAYIARPSDIGTFLTEKIKRLVQVYAEQVQMTLEPGSGVQLQSAYRLQPEAMPLPTDLNLHLGNLLVKSSLSVLLEWVVQPIPQDRDHLFLSSGTLQLNIPSRPHPEVRLRFNMSRPARRDASFEPPPRLIFDAMSQITLYRLQEQARQEAAAGQVDQANRRLQHLATNLLSQGRRELAQTVLMEAEHLHHTRTLSATGEKHIKYGTRALLLPPGKAG